jgi:cyanate permease
MAAPPQPDRWAVLAGAWSVYAAFGLLVASTGALVPLIKADLGLSDSQMGLVLGAWQLIYIGASIPGGRVIDRFGVRRGLMASMVVMVASGFGRAAADGMVGLFCAVALLGVGAPIISIGAPKVAASLFEGGDRRTAVAIYSTAPAIGSVLGLALPTNVIGPLVDQNWRSIAGVISALALVALIVWFGVSRSLDEVLVPGRGPDLSSYRAIARIPVVRFVLVLSILNFFYVHGLGQWLVAILNQAGWSSQQAGLWAAFGTAGGLVAIFVVPRLATPARRPWLMAGSLVVGAAAINGLQVVSAPILTVALLGSMLARSALMPLLVLTLMDHRDVGPERIAAATGLFFTTAQIGGVSGPAVTGVLSDISGGFTVPLLAHSGVMLFVAGLVAVAYRRIVPLPDREAT